jgi:prolyl-tRNA synthetase
MSQQAKSTVGPPIWVESVLSAKDYAECAQKYPNTFTNGSKAPLEFKSDFEWRKNMGGRLSDAQINLINSRIDEMHKLIKSDK